MEKKRVFVDMDNVLVDYFSGFKGLDNASDKTTAGVFARMKPLEGAIEAFNKLAEKHDVYILSTAPWRNATAWADKLDWVKKYLGENGYKRLILSHNKALLMGDYLIDDRTVNGAGEFTGEHIHFGTEKFPDWDAVLNYL